MNKLFLLIFIIFSSGCMKEPYSEFYFTDTTSKDMVIQEARKREVMNRYYISNRNGNSKQRQYWCFITTEDFDVGDTVHITVIPGDKNE